jgi:hypothetical protein
MAAVTAVFVGTGGMNSPIPDGPVRREIWRIPAASIADTATITPQFGGKVVSANAPLCDSNLTTADVGASLSVVFTARVAIVGTVDATLYIKD